jgi:hypothetical protein
VATVFATLIIIEIIVRWVPLYPDEISTFDPSVGYRFVPDASGIQFNPGCWLDYRQVIHINSKGLRDEELPYEHGRKFRVLVLGDSFVEAKQVPLEDTFQALLEKSMGVEVVAAGHGGWGTDNELLWYRSEGFRYDPDLVLLVFQPGNDVQDNSIKINYFPDKHPYFLLDGGELVLHTEPIRSQGATGLGGALKSALHDFTLEHSYLYKLFVLRYRRLQLVRGTQPFALDAAAQAGQAEADLDALYQDLYDEAFTLTIALIEQLRQQVEADGAEFVVAIASSDRQIYIGGDNARFSMAFVDRGVAHIDLLPSIREAHSEDRPMHFACDGHWTVDAHRVVARELQEFLLPYMMGEP